MDSLQAYKTMFYILENYYFKTNDDVLGGMLGFMSPELFSGGKPIDASVLVDWEASVEKVSVHEDLSLDHCIDASIKFLEFYNSEFGYDIQWIISDLQKYATKRDEWKDCFKKVLLSAEGGEGGEFARSRFGRAIRRRRVNKTNKGIFEIPQYQCDKEGSD